MIVDAIRYEDAGTIPAEKLLPHVLSMPRRCPCGDTWLILLNEPRALEMEMGSVGEAHLTLLEETLRKNCSNHAESNHLRTDGESVWIEK